VRRFFNVYQYITPLVLFPIAYYIWFKSFGNNHRFVLYVLSMPIITSYIIPALGTNITKLWEFNTRIRLGKFRPQHGFVFGTATSLIAYLCVDRVPGEFGVFEILRSGFIMASVLAFWNWLYDIFAIKSGFMTVYNKQYFEGKGPEAIAMDYAPVYFGVFGLIYGIGVRVGQFAFFEAMSGNLALLSVILFNILALTVPTAVFVLFSYKNNGYSGVAPYKDIRM